MKKLILLTALIIALATAGVSAWAQMSEGQGQGAAHGHGPMSPDQRLQMMTKQLNLTPDQQEKIKPLLENESQQMQTLHQNSSLTNEDRMTQMKQIRQTTNEQIKSDLNPDQQQKFQQMQSHQGHGGPGGMAPGQTPPQLQ